MVASSVSRIAVTGYPGWLTDALVDDLATRPVADLSELLLLTLPSHTGAATDRAAQIPIPSRVVPYDLTVGASHASTFEGVDVLVHTAAVIHVRTTSDWYRVNTLGTLRLAREAKRAGVRRFVYLSSIAAAGVNRGGRDLVETDEPKPKHHYGISKLRAERELLELHEDGAFEVVILRPSMFYGPPVPGRHVDIYKRVLTGFMPLVGSGNYKRSVVYIGNLVQAVRLACTVPEASGQTYFIVDRPTYTTKSVVEAMGTALGVKPKFLRVPAFVGEMAYQVDRLLGFAGIYISPIHLVGESHWSQSASCEKAIAELGYDPDVELDQGMRLAVDWCRSRGLL